MEKIMRFAIYLCFLLFAGCHHPADSYQVAGSSRIDNVIVDSSTDAIEVIIPEIPKDSAARLDDDPPVSYQQPHEEVAVIVPVKTTRDLVREIYLSQIGVREATGKNDGPMVEAYLRNVGLGKGYSWCSAIVRWVFDRAGVKTQITAWSPTAHNPLNILWLQNKQYSEIRSGDVFTLWFASKKRIAHTGFIDSDGGNGIVETVEGNTNGGGSRDGDGVYKRKRIKKTIYSITGWIKD